MEHRFDTLARSLVAEPIPRRSALRRIAGGLAALFVAPAALPALVGAAACQVDSDCAVANGTGACNGNGECAIVACDAGFANCDGVFESGCAVDTNGDPANCGACNNVCAAPNNASATCTNGKCGFACIPGFVQSGTQCVSSGGGGGAIPCTGGCAAANATTDCNHTTGMCFIATCNAGFADCDGNYANGCEVNTNTDTKNCGACGKVCPAVLNASATCAAGVCGFTCNAGFTLCNGACVDLKADAKNCGACGHACTAPEFGSATCTGGVCGFTCNAGFSPCGGKCVPTASFQTDKKNCGTCGNIGARTAVANATTTCTAGTCGFVCNAGFTNATGRAGELPDGTAKNCGACGQSFRRGDTCAPATHGPVAVCTDGQRSRDGFPLRRLQGERDHRLALVDHVRHQPFPRRPDL